MLFDFLQNFIKCHLREYVTFLTKSWGVFVAALGNVGVPGALPHTFMTPSRAVFPQWSSCHVCSGSIRGSDMEGCWGGPGGGNPEGLGPWLCPGRPAPSQRLAARSRPELGHGRGTRDEHVTRRRPLLFGEGTGEHISMSPP